MTYVAIPPASATLSTITGLTDKQVVFGTSTGGASSSADFTYDDTTNDLSITASESGGTVGLTLANSSNTASSIAAITAQVAGTSAGDPVFRWIVNGTTTWSGGADNSDSDTWKLAPNADVGTSPAISITTAGAVTLGGGLLAVAPASSAVTILPAGSGDGFRFNVTAAAGGLLSGIYLGSVSLSAGEGFQLLTDNTATVGVVLSASVWDTGAGTAKRLWSGANAASNPNLILCADGGTVTVTDAVDLILSGTTGTKIGTATTQKLGFYNATPVDQPATVADPAGGAIVDAESRTAIIAVIDRLQELGLIA